MLIITTHHLASPRGVFKPTITSVTRGDTRSPDIGTRDTCVAQMLVFSEMGDYTWEDVRISLSCPVRRVHL